MDPVFLKEILIVCLFVIVIFCVAFPLQFSETLQKRGIDLFHSHRYAATVSILNCFAAGIFLGTCLLHLFPDVRDSIDQMNLDLSFPFAEFTIALGFFLLLTIEQIISDFRERSYAQIEPSFPSSSSSERLPILSSSNNRPMREERDSNNGPMGEERGSNNRPMGEEGRNSSPPPPQDVLNHEQNTSIRLIALILALSIHSIFEGIAIGVQNTVEKVIQITGALLIHKIVIAFSLGLTLTQSPFGFYKSLLCGMIFAVASPFGVGIGLLVTKLETVSSSLIVGTLQGMAAGTFLYVTFLEVLPNEFRQGHLHLPKLLSFIIGFSVICAAILLFPDS